MAPNNSETKTAMYDEEDLRKKNHSRVTSVIAKDTKSAQKGYMTLTEIKKWFEFKTELKWKNILLITLFHTGVLYTCYVANTYVRNMKTCVWILLVATMQGWGVTGGVHRLWTHRSYKAKLPLRVMLLIFYTIAGQNKISDWVRDHRVHHKYTDTDADPHNSNRGFFFSHIGWLMMKKHPEVIRRGREIDMSDVLTDPVVVFGDKYFSILKMIFCFVLPIIIPVYVWNETWTWSICTQIFLRYVITLHFVWSVNSVAHIWGSKPYNAFIKPTNNKVVSLVACGEGWHNYHHVFPWDYKASEFGDYKLNTTTMFLDFCAKIGWAYDLKYPSQQLVMSVMKNRGDGSHLSWDPVTDPDSKIKE